MAEHRFSSVNGIHIESRRGVFGNKTNIPSMAKTFFFHSRDFLGNTV